MYQQVTAHGRRIVETLQTQAERGSLTCARALVGAEIGVFRGKNAATLLARMPNLKLYLVDHWGSLGQWRNEPLDMTGRQDTPGSEEAILTSARSETAFAGERRVWIRAASPAAADFIQEPLDFAFVDGDHRYEACLADLRAWWPKLKPDGVLFGHDIDNADPRFAHWGVRRAVEQFCEEHELSFTAYPPPEMVFAIHKPPVQS